MTVKARFVGFGIGQSVKLATDRYEYLDEMGWDWHRGKILEVTEASRSGNYGSSAEYELTDPENRTHQLAWVSHEDLESA